MFARGLVRHAGGVKEAWFVRTEEPFRRIYSREWCCGDPKDPAAITHRVECFSSRKTRQFGVDGPHTRERGATIRSYSFAGGASPANTPRELLPVLPKAAFAAARDLFDAIAAAAGLTAIKAEKQGNATAHIIYDLTDDMVFESSDGTYRLSELEDALCAAQHEGHDLRVTSSFLGHGTNATKCIVGYAKHRRYVFIHDFETELTHKPANRASPAVFNFFERLHKGTG
ncbi:MAG TPA: hypothetical protein VKE42_04950 [Candidatus Cybelea sp.]|nr:hypothetical protein [Candidatus Cybelea sp.]